MQRGASVPGVCFVIYIWEAHIWEADSRPDMTRI